MEEVGKGVNVDSYVMVAMQRLYQKRVGRVKGGKRWQGVMREEGEVFEREWGEALREGKGNGALGVWMNFLYRMRKWCGGHDHTYVLDIVCDSEVMKRAYEHLLANSGGDGKEWDWMGEEEGVKWIYGELERMVKRVRMKRGKEFRFIYGKRKGWEENMTDQLEELEWRMAQREVEAKERERGNK